MPIAEIACVEGDFMRAMENLFNLVKQSKNGGISLLIVDAPYGVADENGDNAWCIDQLRGTLATVEYCNPSCKKWEITNVHFFPGCQIRNLGIKRVFLKSFIFFVQNSVYLGGKKFTVPVLYRTVWYRYGSVR